MVQDEVVECASEDTGEDEDHQDIEDQEDVETLLCLGDLVLRLPLVEDQLGVGAAVGHNGEDAAGVLENRTLPFIFSII